MKCVQVDEHTIWMAGLTAEIGSTIILLVAVDVGLTTCKG
jgi:hypothetical protein